jgi:hypothetical protein
MKAQRFRRGVSRRDDGTELSFLEIRKGSLTRLPRDITSDESRFSTVL